MASNETVKDVYNKLCDWAAVAGLYEQTINDFAVRFLAAHEREIAERDKAVAEAEEQLELEHAGYIETGAIAGFREQLRQRDAEIEKLRALVKGLADVAERFVSCKGTECETVCGVDAKCIHKKTIELVAKAREVVK